MRGKRKEQKLLPCDVFWIFLLGSMIGFFLEGIWSILMRGAWENHASLVWGPFCIIYGIGAVMMYILSFYIKGQNSLVRFALFALTGSALEYAASVFQEIVFGSVSWNYEGQFGNLNGRVSLRMTLIWGSLGLLFSVFLFPLLEKLLVHLRGKYQNTLCICLCGFMLVNFFMSAAAVLRWGERAKSIPASGSFEAFLDDHYGDERLQNTFTNLNFLD